MSTNRPLLAAPDPTLVAAFARARAMGGVYRDAQGRRYVWSDERGLWLRVGRTPLRVVGAEGP